jgi:lactoylglutathione lyase
VRTLHLGIQVTDLEKSLAFYTGLGYHLLGGVPATDFGSLTMLALPGDEFVTLELVHDPATAERGPGGLHHLVIGVDDLHGEVARLAGVGIVAEPPSSPDGSTVFWTAWLTDPDGYRIELVQWPPGHPAGMTRADLMPVHDAQGTADPRQTEVGAVDERSAKDIVEEMFCASWTTILVRSRSRTTT